jgi:hypothetical protein
MKQMTETRVLERMQGHETKGKVQAMFGLDSAADSRTVLAAAEEKYGAAAVIARYLRTIERVSTGLCAEEIAYLHAQGKAIALICNDDQDGSGIGSGETAPGAALAGGACLLAKQLGAPSGTRIFFDVEAVFRFTLSAALAIAQRVVADGYRPGFYLNPIGGVDHSSGYQALRAAAPSLDVVYWTSENQWTADVDTPISDFLVDVNHAAAVAGYESECVGWQTAINRPPGVDLDCWRNLDGLWTPAPVSYRIIQACALKPTPDHMSSPVAQLAAGAIVALDPPVTPHWQHIHTSHEQGWVLTDNLEAVS